MAAKKKTPATNIEARLAALRADFESLQGDLKGLAGDVSVVASERATLAMRSAEENAETLRVQVRQQPITSLLIAGGIGAFLGAIFLRR